MSPGPARLECRIDTALRAALPPAPAEFVLFVLRQGWACLFGGLMLAALVGTRAVWQPDWPLHRYDALLLFALALQAGFLALGLETWAEARVIAVFHLTGTVMEWFKVAAGSWSYPEPALFAVLGVPLFSGFMYASVGSYIARAIRLFEMTFAPWPPRWCAVGLPGAIYVNFFAHHWLPDARWVLMLGTLVVFGRTRVQFTVAGRHGMPLPLAAALAALALYLAENVGTLTGTWVYAGQAASAWAPPAKLGSWYLLLWVSFVSATLALGPARRGWPSPAEGPRSGPCSTPSPSAIPPCPACSSSTASSGRGGTGA